MAENERVVSMYERAGFECNGCYACEMDCKRGLLNKIKPYGFTEGIIGDYDEFDDVEMLIEFIKTGKRSN